jgi:hypothetical protein
MVHKDFIAKKITENQPHAKVAPLIVDGFTNSCAVEPHGFTAVVPLVSSAKPAKPTPPK